MNPGVERKSESCRQSVDRTQSPLPTKLLSKVLRKNIRNVNTESLENNDSSLICHRMIKFQSLLDFKLWPKLVTVQ